MIGRRPQVRRESSNIQTAARCCDFVLVNGLLRQVKLKIQLTAKVLQPSIKITVIADHNANQLIFPREQVEAFPNPPSEIVIRGRCGGHRQQTDMHAQYETC